MKVEQPSVKSIFDQALEIASSQERQAFLAAACADFPDVRLKVDALLKAYEDAGSFLESSVDGPVVTSVSLLEQPGTLIGPYKLKELIGEGGMGLVFVAEQQEPVRRKVALKIIKPGMDTRDVIARFEAERQALALMDHPNIAKVLDAGATDSGRPYFVMELVKGMPITDYCDQNALTPRERLDLFVNVCQAVQHAHTKGVIHRDLKPNNVLIAPHDGKPVVKVIDFGVAKAIGQPLTDKSIYTRLTQMIGTPLYMSPEQAEINALDIDTRSDVYGLGVLLYELLTGTTPFDRQRLHTAAFDEIRRIIREEEPPKPSTRLTILGAGLSAMSAKRKTEPAKLSALFKGDLDWIVMKALEKDRTRRYDTASAMAADVRRFLNEEPVEARPPSSWYRFRKMARRNKAVMTTAALVAAALLLGTGVSAWQAVRAMDAEAEALAARDQESQQRLAAEKQRQIAVAEKEQADTARSQALKNEQKAAANAAMAEKNETKAEWRLYASQIVLAQRAWESNNPSLFYHYLNQCRPDFRGWEHDYLYTLANAGHQTLMGHRDFIYDVAYSLNGKLLASAGGTAGGSELIIWDLKTGKVMWNLPGHAKWIRSICFSPDSSRLASAAGDKSVKVWDMATGKEVLSLKEHRGTVWNVAYSPDGKLLASVSGEELTIWDAASGEKKQTLLGHTSVVHAVAFSPDGKFLASGSTDLTVKVWEVQSGTEVRTLTGFKQMAYNRVAYSHNGKRLVCRERDVVKLWDTENWQEMWAIELAGTGRVVFSLDDKTLTCGAAGAIKLLDVNNGKVLQTLKGHTNNIVAIALSPDGKRLASGSHDNTVKILDLPTNHDAAANGVSKEPNSTAVSPDGATIARIADNGTLEVWDAVTGKALVMLERKMAKSTRLTFSPNGKLLASVNSHGITLGFPTNDEAKVWNITTGKAILICKRDLVTRIVFSPDSKRLAIHSIDLKAESDSDELMLWHLESGKEIIISRNSGEITANLVFSHDGQRLAFGIESSDDALLDKKPALKGRPANIEIQLWDLNTHQRALTLKGHTASVRCLAFSRDGQRLVSASQDMSIKIWDITKGQAVLTLTGHTSGVNSVDISPDGKRIASSSYDNAVKVWETATGQEVMSFAHNGFKVEFSSDGKQLSATTPDKLFSDRRTVVKQWDASKSMSEMEQKK